MRAILVSVCAVVLLVAFTMELPAAAATTNRLLLLGVGN